MTRTVAVAFHEPIVGGSATGFLRILPALEARGWRFLFWAPGPGPLEDELRRRGYDVAGEPRLLRYSRDALRVPPGTVARLASVPSYLWRFRAWVNAQSPALVQANTLITVPEAAVARTTGSPVVLYVHEMLPRGAKGKAAAALMRGAHSVVTNSTASAAALRRAGVRARVAPYGIEMPPQPRPRPDHRTVVVGTLGTVSHRKGSDVFVEAARRVLREEPRVEFRMIGPYPDGPERPWAGHVVERARRSGVAMGVAPDPFTELGGWDLLVLPSRSEAFGLVLIEAMAMGLPVIATRIDGPAEIVTPDTGILVDVDDLDALTGAILGLVRDRHRRHALGAAGRVRAERHFTVDRQADVVHATYLDALARCRRSGADARGPSR